MSISSANRPAYPYDCLATAVAEGTMTETEALTTLKASGHVTKYEEQRFQRCLRQERALRRPRILVLIVVVHKFGPGHEVRLTHK